MAKKESSVVKKEESKQLQKDTKDLSPSERFTINVISEYGTTVGGAELAENQKRLAQNYFISIDMALKKAESDRQKKGSCGDKVPVTWQNVNLSKLAKDVVVYSKIGLDPIQPNHIHVIPFKNNNTGKYDIGFMEGYAGIEIKSKKYGYDVPKYMVAELVFKNDTFIPVKKDQDNEVESYEFKINNAFDRGEVVGGFYYHAYEDKTKNKLVIFSKKDIEKRKPAYASPEFWGGEKDEWVKDPKTGKSKKSGKKVKVEGWYEEMALKTIKRACYNDITIDSNKIDDNLRSLIEIQNENTQKAKNVMIEENANSDEELSFEEVEYVDEDTGEITDGKTEPENPTEGKAPEENAEKSNPPAAKNTTSTKKTEKPEDLFNQAEGNDDGPGF